MSVLKSVKNNPAERKLDLTKKLGRGESAENNLRWLQTELPNLTHIETIDFRKNNCDIWQNSLPILIEMVTLYPNLLFIFIDPSNQDTSQLEKALQKNKNKLVSDPQAFHAWLTDKAARAIIGQCPNEIKSLFSNGIALGNMLDAYEVECAELEKRSNEVLSTSEALLSSKLPRAAGGLTNEEVKAVRDKFQSLASYQFCDLRSRLERHEDSSLWTTLQELEREITKVPYFVKMMRRTLINRYVNSQLGEETFTFFSQTTDSNPVFSVDPPESILSIPVNAILPEPYNLSPLQLAFHHKSLHCFRELLAFGANPFERNATEKSLFRIIIESRHSQKRAFILCIIENFRNIYAQLVESPIAIERLLPSNALVKYFDDERDELINVFSTITEYIIGNYAQRIREPSWVRGLSILRELAREMTGTSTMRRGLEIDGYMAAVQSALHDNTHYRRVQNRVLQIASSARASVLARERTGHFHQRVRESVLRLDSIEEARTRCRVSMTDLEGQLKKTQEMDLAAQERLKEKAEEQRKIQELLKRQAKHEPKEYYWVLRQMPNLESAQQETPEVVESYKMALCYIVKTFPNVNSMRQIIDGLDWSRCVNHYAEALQFAQNENRIAQRQSPRTTAPTNVVPRGMSTSPQIINTTQNTRTTLPTPAASSTGAWYRSVFSVFTTFYEDIRESGVELPNTRGIGHHNTGSNYTPPL